ncbi:MAG: hypothetical protein WCK50_03715, partial [bacterium]
MEASGGAGTWAHFAARLNVDPRRGVVYLSHLLEEREAWIEDELASGAFASSWSTVDDTGASLGEVREIEPSEWVQPEDEDEGAGDEGGDEDDDTEEDAVDWEADEGDWDAAATASSEAAARAPFRGRAWYPRLYAIVPVFKPRRRAVCLDNRGVASLCGNTPQPTRTLDELLARPHARARAGEVLDKTVVTNGVSVSVLYKLPGAPTSRRQVGGAVLSPRSAAASVPDGAVVRGLDPGVGDIWRVSPASGSHLRGTGFSQKQWRSDTHAEERLRETRAWCAPVLAAPGGPWERLREVSVKTSSLARFVAYAIVAQETRPAILAERMKRKWADAEFQAWRLGKRALARGASAYLAGSLEDGTLGVPTYVAYGNARWSGIRGRQAGPTTAARTAFDVAARAFQGGRHVVRDEDEFKTTQAHSACGGLMQDVYGPPTRAQRERAAAKAARPLPEGWTRPPARPLPA